MRSVLGPDSLHEVGLVVHLCECAEDVHGAEQEELQRSCLDHHLPVLTRVAASEGAPFGGPAGEDPPLVMVPGCSEGTIAGIGAVDGLYMRAFAANKGASCHQTLGDLAAAEIMYHDAVDLAERSKVSGWGCGVYCGASYCFLLLPIASYSFLLLPIASYCS